MSSEFAKLEADAARDGTTPPPAEIGLHMLQGIRRVNSLWQAMLSHRVDKMTVAELQAKSNWKTRGGDAPLRTRACAWRRARDAKAAAQDEHDSHARWNEQWEAETGRPEEAHLRARIADEIVQLRRRLRAEIETDPEGEQLKHSMRAEILAELAAPL